MGTRNLTCVYLDGEYKVAQYGQWDGYPEGQGMTCLKFVRDEMDEKKFKEHVRIRRFASNSYLRDLGETYGAVNGWMSLDDSKRLRDNWPQFSRDTAAEILLMIQNDHVSLLLKNDITFAADSLFCEWAYVIDLDKRTFEVYEGFNQEPLTEDDRFFFLEEKSNKEHRGEDKYHPVKLVKLWSLDELPTEEEFLNAFNKEEEE